MPHEVWPAQDILEMESSLFFLLSFPLFPIFFLSPLRGHRIAEILLRTIIFRLRAYRRFKIDYPTLGTFFEKRNSPDQVG